jgi:hypothetical protein
MILKTVPRIDDKGEVILFDMYVDGEWHGSCRLQSQCDLHFEFIQWKDEVIRHHGCHVYHKLVDTLGYSMRSCKMCSEAWKMTMNQFIDTVTDPEYLKKSRSEYLKKSR